jgi:MFS family permease
VLIGEDQRAVVQRRTLRVLVAGQVLGGAAVGVGAGVSALLAKEILGDDTWAGLAFAAVSFGSAGASIPLSRMMARRGRRYGLVRGYLIAMAGAVGCVIAAETESFALLLVSLVAFGWSTATNLLARYAAVDLSIPQHRARDLSTVVWATTVGAVAGPNVLGPAERLAEVFDLPSLAGPYLISMSCLVLAMVVAGTFLRPDPLAAAGLLGSDAAARPRTSSRAALRAIASRQESLVGLATMATAHAVMVAVMAMTPLHLRDHGDSLQLVGFVISLHLAGMYAFAPLVGAVTDRVGPLRVARTAAATLIGAGLLAAAGGHNHVIIGGALFLLGLGWSMATISGSTIVTATTPPEERAEVQGVADMTMSFLGGVGGIVAGFVVGAFGFATLSSAAGAVAAALLVMVVLRGPMVRRPA